MSPVPLLAYGPQREKKAPTKTRAPTNPPGWAIKQKFTKGETPKIKARRENLLPAPPLVTSAWTTMITPNTAMIDPSTNGKYPGPMRLGVPIGYSETLTMMANANPITVNITPDQKSFGFLRFTAPPSMKC